MQNDNGSKNSNGSLKVVYYAGALFLVVTSVVMAQQIFQPSWFKNIKAEVTSQPYARTISVNGDAKVSSKPDIAWVSLSVVSQGTTVKQVTTDSNGKMTQVIAAVKKLGIEDKDITTSQYSLTPTYRYPENKTPEMTGYTLNQEVSLKIRNLEITDDVLDMSTKAGANQVGQLSFDIDDTNPLKKEAREKAFAAAQAKAQEMANAAGVRLGRVVTFSESGDVQPPVYKYAMAMDTTVAPQSAPAPSIQAGSKELQVNVTVTYEIE